MSGTIHRLAPNAGQGESLVGRRVGRVIPIVGAGVYGARDIAEMLALTLTTTYQLCRNGDIPASKIGGRWVIPKKRFHVWIDNLPTADPEDDPR